MQIDEEVGLEFDFAVIPNSLNVCTSIHVRDKEGVCAFVSGTRIKKCASGRYRHSYIIPPNLMNDGLYTIDIHLITETTRIEVRIRNVLSFTVHETAGRLIISAKLLDVSVQL